MYKIRTSLAVLIVLSLLTACGATNTDTIKIGVVAPLTGPGSQLGELYVEGAQLAVNDINTQHILDKPIELLVEDTNSDAKNAVTAMKKLVEVDDVKFILTTMSTHGLALKPLAKEYNIVLFGDVAHPNMTGGNPRVFRHSQTVESEVEAIFARLNGTVGVLYSDEDYGTEFNRVLSAKRSVLSQSFDLKGSDFRAELSKFAETDEIVIVGVGSAFNLAVKQAREMYPNKKIITNLGFAISNTKDLGALVNGVQYTSFFYARSEKWAEFVQGFKAKYGKEPQPLHLISYGTVELLVERIRRSGENPQEVASALHNIGKFQGTYEKMQVTEKGDVPIPIVLMQN